MAARLRSSAGRWIVRLWQRWGRWRLPVLSCALSLCAATGCAAEPAALSTGGGPFAPSETRTLQSFGAVGDGKADDTVALARALATTDRYCLDGEGKNYRIVGTLRATQSLCLRNAVLKQAMRPFDTRPYVGGPCPVVSDPSARADCGDLAIPAERLSELRESLHVRTLLIMPDSEERRIRVNLERVTIDRGSHPEGGSRTESAGIWLVGADRVDFRDVVITGHGKGFGLSLLQSQNITLTNLNLHDLTWSPYRGDTLPSVAEMAKIGWNKVPIREVQIGPDGGRFRAVRVQEQLTCVYLAGVQNVVIRNIDIRQCTARLNGNSLPWQTDGLTVGGGSANIAIHGAKVDTVWEGIDIVGGGGAVRHLLIDDLSVSNAFAFGLKIGQTVVGTRVSRLQVANVGLAGLILSGAVSDARISNASITGVGTIVSAGKDFAPWPVEATAGIRIDEGQGGSPSNVAFRDAVIGVGARSGSYAFGLMNTGGTRLDIVRLRAEGFARQRISGATARP